MSVVYHANYFTWFEAARIELLDRMGCLTGTKKALPSFIVGKIHQASTLMTVNRPFFKTNPLLPHKNQL